MKLSRLWIPFALLAAAAAWRLGAETDAGSASLAGARPAPSAATAPPVIAPVRSSRTESIQSEDGASSVLVGRIVTRVGARLAGARVSIAGAGVDAIELTTDEDGEFRFRPRTPYVKLNVRAPGFVECEQWRATRASDWPCELALSAGRVVRGVLASNAPLGDGGVEIELLRYAHSGARLSWRLTALGEFELDDAPNEELWLLARAPGFVPQVVRAPAGGDEPCVVFLSEGVGASLEVRAVGGQLGTVRLALRGAAGSPGGSVQLASRDAADAEVATFEDLPSGRVQVNASMRGAPEAEERAEIVLVAGRRAQCELTFPPATRTEGVVLDSDTLEPLGGLQLELWDKHGGARARCVSSADGRFSVDGLHPRATLHVASLSPDWVLVDAPLWGHVELPAANERTDRAVLAQRARELRGTLVGTDGDVSGACVELYRGAPREGSLIARSEARDGRFVFTLPAQAAGWCSLFARTQDAIGFVEFDLSTCGGEAPTLELQRTATVFGRVATAGAAPTAVQVVPLHERQRTPRGWGERRSAVDAQGAFRVEGLAPGWHRLAAVADGAPATEVFVEPGQDLGPVELGCDSRDRRTLSGVVVDELGAPACDVQVGATAIEDGVARGAYCGARTGEDGRFELAVASPGLHEVNAVRIASLGGLAERAITSLRASPGDQGLRLVVRAPQTATVAGRVVGGDVEACSVVVSNGRDGLRLAFDTSAFEIADAPAGALTIRLQRTGCAERVLQVEADSGSHVDLGDVRLSELRTLAVRVVDDRGQPCPGTDLFACSAKAPAAAPPASETWVGRTDDFGRFSAPLVGDVDVRIVAWRRGWALGERVVSRDHAQGEVELELRRGVCLRVDGIQSALAEFPTWFAELRRTDATRELVRRHGVNRYVPWLELRDLAPGEYELDVRTSTPSAAQGWRVTLALERGGDRVVRLDIDGRRTPAEESSR